LFFFRSSYALAFTAERSGTDIADPPRDHGPRAVPTRASHWPNRPSQPSATHGVRDWPVASARRRAPRAPPAGPGRRAGGQSRRPPAARARTHTHEAHAHTRRGQRHALTPAMRAARAPRTHSQRRLDARARTKLRRSRPGRAPPARPPACSSRDRPARPRIPASPHRLADAAGGRTCVGGDLPVGTRRALTRPPLLTLAAGRRAGPLSPRGSG
jgi:hypothetical protein